MAEAEEKENSKQVMDYRRPTRPQSVLTNYGRGIAEAFTRENIISYLKTFAWVAPLTILIWVYAEREQLAPYKDATIPIEVHISAPNRIARLVDFRDKNVVADLAGPNERLNIVKQELVPREGSARIVIEVDPSLSPGQIHEIPTTPLLASQELFKSNGVTVSGCQPAKLRVEIDELVDQVVPVSASPDLKTSFDRPPTFTPATVKLHGPKREFEDAAKADSLRVYANFDGRDELSAPGQHDLKALPLTLGFTGTDVTIAPTTVDATVVVRSTDKTVTLDSIAVLVVAPKDLLNDYRVAYDPTLPRVTLVGPPDIIDAITSQAPSLPVPKAMFEVTPEDRPLGSATSGKTRTQVLRYFDLPETVRVADQDKARKIDFHLERVAPEQ